MNQSLTWGEQERRQPRRPRALVSRVASAFAWVFSALIVVAVYSNVLVDDAALRGRAEALAKKSAACGEHCRITSTQVRRSVLDYRADFELDGAKSVHIVCRRDAIALGEQHCTAQ